MIRKKLEYLGLAAASFLIIFLLWWLVTAAGLVKEFFLPSPLAVYRAALSLFFQNNFIGDIGISAVRILLGFLVAVILSVPLGILIGLNKKVEAFFEPLIDFIRYTPVPAFIPLFILWFGIGETEKIVVIASTVFFQLVLMVANSVALTPKVLVDSAKTLGANKWQIIYQVIYPYSLPKIFDDLRVSMGWAWSGLILAEIVGSTSGLGFVIIQSQRLLQTGNVIAAIIVVGLLGLVTDYLFKALYRLFFPWAPKIQGHA